ncbi:MAG: hypothetical protein D5R98_05905 [Desulfonatronovibrio sp. MSAO_Bac4]|nr:MAG: hypothetical protein D5R98_05905 [Desulfonatronovibrio sp. MSAO_Bac4]
MPFFFHNPGHIIHGLPGLLGIFIKRQIVCSRSWLTSVFSNVVRMGSHISLMHAVDDPGSFFPAYDLFQLHSENIFWQVLHRIAGQNAGWADQDNNCN